MKVILYFSCYYNFALIAAFYLLLSDSAVKTLTLVLMFVISIIVIVGGLLLIYKVIKPKYNLLEAKVKS